MPAFEPVIIALIGYLLGSIPFGLILTRWGGAGDVRAIGSGSIGATNVLRTGRKGLAAATLLLDAAKGAAAVVVAQAIDPRFAALGAAMAMVGHCYPAWLAFKGGKGIATALGILLAIDWRIALICAATWAVVFAASRISSLGSLSAVAAAPIAALLLDAQALLPLLIALAVLIVWKHRANIGRLIDGTEPRFGSKPAS